MDTSTDTCVAINGVSYSWLDKPIYQDISLNILKGKITAIMGPSGTGKTTLLRLIGGQLRPSAGTILFNGTNVHALTANQLFKLREQMGLLFQSGALFSNLTVFENVAFPYREHTSLSKQMIYHLVNMKLEVVGLRGAKNLMPNELSGGMKRRVAIARSLALDPTLMMFDEPFVGQDPITVGILMKLITELNKNLNMTIIIVSHDVVECLQLADYLYILSAGEIVGEGTSEVIKNSTNQAIQQFVNGSPDGAIPFHYPAKPLYEELIHVN